MEKRKEIWKLIELLNEYEKSWLNEFELEKYEEWWYCKWNWRIFRGNWENGNELTPYELCSKQYWFIKWLVENDKIDTEKIENSEYYLIDWFYYNERKKFWIEWLDDVEKILLMLLSISDTPIEFLISLLKNV